MSDPCAVIESQSCCPEMNTSGSWQVRQAGGPSETDQSGTVGTAGSTHVHALNRTLHVPSSERSAGA
jgi:hypothetical protein